MSRNEGKIAGRAAAAVEAAEILAALGREAALARPSRKDAISCYFAAGEGWKEASRLLGGAFADEPGLRGPKGE